MISSLLINKTNKHHHPKTKQSEAPRLKQENKTRKYLQYHNTVGVGKDLWASSSPTPLLKKAPYSRLHRKVFELFFSVAREEDSTIFLDSLPQCSVTLTVKKLCHVCIELPMLQFSLTAPCPVPAHH